MGFINPGTPYHSRSIRPIVKESISKTYCFDDIQDLIPTSTKRRIASTHDYETIIDNTQIDDLAPIKKFKIIALSQRPPLLESLPVDILYKIFTFVKLGQNNLHLVNKHLNVLFKSENLGSFHIERIIKCQFVYDLNSEIRQFYPYIEQLQQKFRVKNVNPDKLSELNENLTLFKAYEHGLDIAVFKFQPTFNLSLEFFTKYFLLDVNEIEQEKVKRYNYIKSAIKDLNNELTSDERTTPVDLGINSLLNEETSQHHQIEPSTYKFGVPVPKFPSSFNNINSSRKYTTVKILMENLNFKFSNPNMVISTLLSNKLPSKRKSKIIKVILKCQLFQIDDTVILQSFHYLIHCKYNPDFESIVHKLLSVFYKSDNSDGELWNFIKVSKEVDLFHILRGYSNPNFQL